MTFKQFLNEEIYKSIKYDDYVLNIHKNPIKSDIKSEGKYKIKYNRGMVNVKNGELYVWSGDSSYMHDNFSDDLFVSYIPLYLHDNGEVESMLYAKEDEKFKNWVLEILKKNKNIKKYYNNKVINIYITDFH